MSKLTQVNEILEGEQYLSGADSRLGELIASQGPISHQPRPDYFASLARSIIGQQVSMAAAAAIFGRFEIATDLLPAKVVALNEDELRAVGLSRQKASYLHDLAQHFHDNSAIFDHLDTLDDDAIISELTAVKGIGLWTAQMFLMFTLIRLDVFAPDDVGLQRAMKQLHGWDTLPPKAELVAAADRWRPYRTIACWHLWKSLNNAPTDQVDK